MNAIEDVYQKYCTKRFPLPTEFQLRELEEQLGLTFPDYYREFLLKYNGGIFDAPIFGTEKREYEKSPPLEGFRYLYGVNGPKHAILGKESEILLFNFRVDEPILILPIGYTFSNSTICLLHTYNNKGFGEIVLRRDFGSPLLPGEWFHLASDMEEFFGLLREPLE